MNWSDFLSLASRLSSGGAEAEWRTGVSRAYYAVLNNASRIFTALNFVVPRADRAHQYVVFRLSNCGDLRVEQAGRDLETLRRLRNRADYDDAPPVTRSQSGAAVQLAESIIQTLDVVKHEPARTLMRDTMVAYERDVLRDVTWHP